MSYDKYISTTLPYANSVPHIGHSLEFIQADALVRFFKEIKKEKVFFNIGVDEHGLKVYTKAKELNVDTQEYLDSLTVQWKQFCDQFQIGYDNFYRTTSIVHIGKVQRFWRKCLDRGDLYKKTYTGKYCAGCEAFKTETDLVDGKCPDHGTEPSIIEEENWFFNVSKYKGLVYGWLQENKSTFLSPQSKVEELENIILNAEDVSVSRLKKNVPWGITVPGEPDQVIYVWFEALLNYIFAVGDEYQEQHFIQICGPDNLRFQGSLFQTILQSAGLNHTQKLLVHGTVLDVNGKKMSKSIGNVIDPIDQYNKYGLDAVRYYTLAGLSTYGNGSWSESDLIKLYNSELADDFGNLISRTLHLIDQKGVTVVPPTAEYKKHVDSIVYSVKTNWEFYEIQSALKETNWILKFGNKYINDEKPWEKDKDFVQILSNLYYALCEANELYLPVLSKQTYSLIKEALVEKKKVIIFKKLESNV